MKLTVAGLRRLIKEEARKVLRENAEKDDIISAIEDLGGGGGFDVGLSQIEGPGGLKAGVERVFLIGASGPGRLYVREGERPPGENYIDWIGYPLRGATVDRVIQFVESLGDVQLADLDVG